MVLVSEDYTWKMHAKCLPYFWYPEDTPYILASTIIFLGRKPCLFENFGNLFPYKGGGFTSSRETIGRDIVGKLFKPLTLFDSFCQCWRMRGEIEKARKWEVGFLVRGEPEFTIIWRWILCLSPFSLFNSLCFWIQFVDHNLWIIFPFMWKMLE